METDFPSLLNVFPNEEFQWASNLFVKNIEMQHISASMQKQGTDILRNENLPAEFQQKPLHNTWMGLKNEHHNLVSTTA